MAFLGRNHADVDRPLVICDVDEVLVHFLKGFEAYLGDYGYLLEPASFALNGNILDRQSRRAAEAAMVGTLLNGFFAERTAILEPVPFAAEALRDLSRHAEIVLLSNLPEVYREARLSNLSRHGYDYPLVLNEGGKGPAVKRIAARRRAPVIFIDDIPSYLASAYEHAPQSHLIHFMLDERFARHVPAMDFLSLTTNNWQQVHAHARGILELD